MLIILFLLTSILSTDILSAQLSEEKAQEIAENCIKMGCAKKATLVKKSVNLISKTSILIVNRSTTKTRKTNLLDKNANLNEGNSDLGKLEAILDNDKSKLDNELSKLDAEITDTEIKIVLKNSVLFSFDEFTLRDDALLILDKVLQVLNYKELKNKSISIYGHTDWIGTNSYNQTLSINRANSVANWFTSNGISKKRLSVIGYGETQPIDTNETDKGRQNNRRVEIVIKK